MSLWGSKDLANNAPKFTVFSGIGAVANGVSGNGQALFANTTVGVWHANVTLGVDGLTAAEKANTTGPAHAGWVNRKEGTGGVVSIVLTNAGSGYTGGNGFITFAGGGNGSGANASYTVNAANGNSVSSVTLVNGGFNYNAAAITANTVATYTVKALFTVTVGGRAGRNEYETLVASGSIV